MLGGSQLSARKVFCRPSSLVRFCPLISGPLSSADHFAEMGPAWEFFLLIKNFHLAFPCRCVFKSFKWDFQKSTVTTLGILRRFADHGSAQSPFPY